MAIRQHQVSNGRTASTAQAAKRIFYPEGDGKPMAETPLHATELFRLWQTLERFLKDDPNAYTGGNMFLYYEEGNRHKSVSPDVFASKGMAKEPLRRTYRLWEEGVPPTLVIEVTSRKTRREDQEKKRDVYAFMGVAEYVLYDPLAEYLRPPLQGLRLGSAGYEPMTVDDTGALISDAFGLRLQLDHGRLQLYDRRSGERLLSPPESAEQEYARAEREHTRAAQERTRAELEHAYAEREHAFAQRETRARQEAEARAEQERALAEREARARWEAEARAERQAAALQALEARLAELERRLSQEPPDQA